MIEAAAYMTKAKEDEDERTLKIKQKVWAGKRVIVAISCRVVICQLHLS